MIDPVTVESDDDETVVVDADAKIEESRPSEHMERIHEIRRRDGIRAAMLALKEHFDVIRKATPPRAPVVGPPPIYDEVYHEGVRAMDADVDTFVGPPLVRVDPSAVILNARPPYGETTTPFDLDAARAVLTRTEHEPPSQTTSDALWFQLRTACDEVERLTSMIVRMHHMVDLTDPSDPIGTALTRAGAYGPPGDDSTPR